MPIVFCSMSQGQWNNIGEAYLLDYIALGIPVFVGLTIFCGIITIHPMPVKK